MAGAALDGQESEPPDLGLPPLDDPRVIVTPHAAFYSEESVHQLRVRTARQVAAKLTGGPVENASELPPTGTILSGLTIVVDRRRFFDLQHAVSYRSLGLYSP